MEEKKILNPRRQTLYDLYESEIYAIENKRRRKIVQMLRDFDAARFNEAKRQNKATKIA